MLHGGYFEYWKAGLVVVGNYVYSLDGWAESGEASIGIQDNKSLAQVWHKRTLVKQACMNWKKERCLGIKVSIYNIREEDTYGFMVKTSGELRDVEDIWLRCLFIRESGEAQA
nr:hypothetical protein [Tanacetum cinerariifolium]